MIQTAGSRMTPFSMTRPISRHRPGSLGEAVRQQSATQSGWQWLQRVTSSKKVSGEAVASGRSGSVAVRYKKMARLETVLLVSDGALSFRKLAQLASIV